MVIGRKKNQKIELTDLEKLRKRVKEIKKRREKMYKRFTNQSKRGGELKWVRFTKEEIFIGSSITGTASLIGNLPTLIR